MDRCAIVATHHKTGTKWMNLTFAAICRALDIPYVNLRRSGLPARDQVRPPMVLFEWHANFGKAKWLVENPEHRLFHLIRDPRDVIISAMHYHRSSREEWLHVPRERFGGLTYQQKLNSLADDHSRYRFEMMNSSGNVIRSIGKWDYGRPNTLECKYEDLIVDTDMKLFTSIVTHLGFSDREIQVCLKQFWRMSIFGKAAGGKAPGGRTVGGKAAGGKAAGGKGGGKGGGKHVRSGRSRQWTGVFDQALAAEFVQEFDGVLEKLGYEPDDSWVLRCPENVGSAVPQSEPA